MLRANSYQSVFVLAIMAVSAADQCASALTMHPVGDGTSHRHDAHGAAVASDVLESHLDRIESIESEHVPGSPADSAMMAELREIAPIVIGTLDDIDSGRIDRAPPDDLARRTVSVVSRAFWLPNARLEQIFRILETSRISTPEWADSVASDIAASQRLKTRWQALVCGSFLSERSGNELYRQFIRDGSTEYDDYMSLIAVLHGAERADLIGGVPEQAKGLEIEDRVRAEAENAIAAFRVDDLWGYATDVEGRSTNSYRLWSFNRLMKRATADELEIAYDRLLAMKEAVLHQERGRLAVLGIDEQDERFESLLVNRVRSRLGQYESIAKDVGILAEYETIMP